MGGLYLKQQLAFVSDAYIYQMYDARVCQKSSACAIS